MKSVVASLLLAALCLVSFDHGGDSTSLKIFKRRGCSGGRCG